MWIKLWIMWITFQSRFLPCKEKEKGVEKLWIVWKSAGVIHREWGKSRGMWKNPQSLKGFSGA